MNRKPTVAIIGTNGLPGRYGGWDQLLNHLTIHLREEYSFIVYTSVHDAEPGLSEVNGAKLKIIGLKANGIQSVPYDVISIIHALFKYDILLILGTSGCVFLPVVKLFRKKIILNPDGAEWKRGKWSKPVQWFLKLSERLGVKNSSIVISDNKVIQKHILSLYGVQSKLIEYGGDNVKKISMNEECKEKYNIVPNCYSFKVCRIEPENNIDLILEVFSETNQILVLIGNWKFSDYGTKLRAKFEKFDNLRLLDPIYDQSKLDELRGNCEFYIHGHSVGGTNPSLVEAMHLGLCCIVYDVDYNRETTENSAVYFNSKDALRNVLRKYLVDQDAPRINRRKMLEIARRRYSWRVITKKYAEVFAQARL